MGTFSSDVTAGNDGTATQFNNLRKDLVLGIANIGSETDGTTVTIDWSNTTKGKIRKIILGGNRTIDFTNMRDGQTILVMFIQDATGGRNPTFADEAAIQWAGSTGYVPTQTANAKDLVAFTYDDNGGSPLIYASVAGYNYGA